MSNPRMRLFFGMLQIHLTRISYIIRRVDQPLDATVTSTTGVLVITLILESLFCMLTVDG